MKQYFRDIKPITVDQIIVKKKFFSRLQRDKNKPFTLVIDLDETLIHTVEEDRSFDALAELEENSRVSHVGLVDAVQVQPKTASSVFFQESVQLVRDYSLYGVRGGLRQCDPRLH